MPAKFGADTMKQPDFAIAKELKIKLSQIIDLIDFRVFGSRARGEADEHSDLDVFIEVGTLTKELKEKISDIVWEVGFENYLVISPLIFTREEIEKSPLKSSSIVRNILEEGITV
ncbi:MAG: nucleotidyltransferase domain-containing protein [Candidatus Schekmanbacteria bacterium]|nr:nucleotidyltransferase domain-containing protein [Candidatus Schekmanbacteria bacterium]